MSDNSCVFLRFYHFTSEKSLFFCPRTLFCHWVLEPISFLCDNMIILWLISFIYFLSVKETGCLCVLNLHSVSSIYEPRLIQLISHFPFDWWSQRLRVCLWPHQKNLNGIKSFQKTVAQAGSVMDGYIMSSVSTITLYVCRRRCKKATLSDFLSFNSLFFYNFFISLFLKVYVSSYKSEHLQFSVDYTVSRIYNIN